MAKIALLITLAGISALLAAL
ncbi:hypothetical protein [Pseudoalteromonas sp. MTN2-4]